MKEPDKIELMEKAKSKTPMNLLDKVLIEVVEEKDVTTLCAKLEAFYLIEGLHNCLYMLKMMFQFEWKKTHPSKPTWMSLTNL